MRAAPETPSTGVRLAGIEGLRALAALTVVANHVWYYSVPDHLATAGPFTGLVLERLDNGLTLFFVLSGFLLYRQFATAIIDGTAAPSARRFLRNRALRILPAYWVILVVVSLAGLATRSWSPAPHDFGQLDPGRLLQNLLLLQNYTPDGLGTGIEPAWSLAVEAVFYLVLPVLALAALRLARGRAVRRRIALALAPAGVLLAIGWVSNVVGWATLDESADRHAQLWGPSWHAVFERSFLCQADLFAYGMLAAVVTALIESGRLADRAWLRPRAALGAVALGVAATLAVHVDAIGERPYRTLFAAACALAVLYVVLPRRRPDPAVRLLEWRPVLWVGVVSYSVYLWHFPVIMAIRDHELASPGRGAFLVTVVAVAAVSVALATVSYRFVEAPAMRRKARTGPRRTPQEARARDLEYQEAAP